jgi:putative ABC transport system permease protein
MMDFVDLILPSLMQGLVLSILTVGIMIPFRILDFPDLSSEGSYPLGGAICAYLILMDVHPGLAIIAAFIGGGLVGGATALVNLKLRINTLLAGILVSTMVYSLNLRLMNRPNLAIFELDNLFSAIGENILFRIITLICVNIIVIVPILLYLYTERGLVLRSVGANKKFARRNGVNVGLYTLAGLFIGNGLCGLAGGILVQLQEYMDISIGVGIVINALAALMIGEALIKPDNIAKQFLAPFVGAILYQQIQGIALSIGLAASDLKFLTGVIVLLILFLNQRNKQ